MSKVRSKNTKLEVSVFRELRRHGIYFQKHYGRVVGKPDIALPRKKRAVFIDGDFWHGYDFLKQKKKMENLFWITKIENNIARDKKIKMKLQEDGWKVLRIWEHDIEKKFDTSIKKIITFLQNN